MPEGWRALRRCYLLLLLLLLLQSMHAGAYILRRLPALRTLSNRPLQPQQVLLQQQLQQRLQQQHLKQHQQQLTSTVSGVSVHPSINATSRRAFVSCCCSAAATTAAASAADAARSSSCSSGTMKREDGASSPAAEQQQQQQQLSPEEQQLKAEREARKKAKEAEKAAKEAAKLAKKKAQEEEERMTALLLMRESRDVEADRFGYLPLVQSQQPAAATAAAAAAAGETARRQFVAVSDLDLQPDGSTVWVRGRLQDCRCKGSLAFLTLREGSDTVQCVFGAETPREMLKWLGGVPIESLVDVLGSVSTPETPILSTTQKKELQGTKLFCVVKAKKELPFVLKDAAQPEDDREDVIRVNLDTRLDNRCFDLRVPATRATARAVSLVSRLVRSFLHSQDFVEIHTPKIIPGASEGGASCFKLPYFGREACLAQSPQLYKQMAIAGDLQRVFEIGPVFRAENSNTHRHLCEFVGIDLEMEIKETYMEVVHAVDGLFKYVFEHLEKEGAKESATIRAQFNVPPFVYLEKTPMLTFSEGVAMLREAGIGLDTIPEDLSEFDLSTELEKALGQLVKQRFNTDYYILLKYPAKSRPFYSMPCPENPVFSNTYDVFMRGEEIASGAQRIHDAVLLRQRCEAMGVPLQQLKSYVDAMELGAPPHGGMGAGLERIVMLYYGLGNIRRVSLFPRDPKRLSP